MAENDALSLFGYEMYSDEELLKRGLMRIPTPDQLLRLEADYLRAAQEQAEWEANNPIFCDPAKDHYVVASNRLEFIEFCSRIRVTSSVMKRPTNIVTRSHFPLKDSSKVTIWLCEGYTQSEVFKSDDWVRWIEPRFAKSFEFDPAAIRRRELSAMRRLILASRYEESTLWVENHEITRIEE